MYSLHEPLALCCPLTWMAFLIYIYIYVISFSLSPLPPSFLLFLSFCCLVQFKQLLVFSWEPTQTLIFMVGPTADSHHLSPSSSFSQNLVCYQLQHDESLRIMYSKLFSSLAGIQGRRILILYISIHWEISNLESL